MNREKLYIKILPNIMSRILEVIFQESISVDTGVTLISILPVVKY